MPSTINADNGVVSGSSGVKTTADTSGVLALQSNGSTGLTLNTDLSVTFAGAQTLSAGTANGVTYLNGSKVLTSGSALTFDGTRLGVGVSSAGFPIDVASISGETLRLRGTVSTGVSQVLFTSDTAGTNYSYLSSASGYLAFGMGSSTEGMRLTSTGLGIGTSSPATKLAVAGGIAGTGGLNISGSGWGVLPYVANSLVVDSISGETRLFATGTDASTHGKYLFYTGTTNGTATERARIDSSGNLLVGKTATTISGVGIGLIANGKGNFTVDSDEVLNVNRLTNDGNLIRFYQASTEEGNISVSGTTVSYNGGHLSRWAQTTTAKDESLVKGTVLSNLDEMNVYTDAEGNPVDNEQLNKVKVSDTEGDANVAGVFVSWSHDDDHNVDEINMAMTGDMIIRIAQGVTVVRGDLLMSAGDGTAKPQGDDIVRSKTVAKVTSNHVTCTYADGSYCVPCVLMAC